MKEPTYPVVSQDLIDQADAREKEKFEELKQHVMEVLQRGKTEIQQDRENWLATREERRALERVQEAGGGHKGSQSSGRSYQTASPEQKNVEQCFPVGPSQGVPPQGQPVQDQTVPGVQHHHDQDLQMKAGGPLWNVPPAPRVEPCLRPMDVYMNQGWLNGIPPGGMPQGAASRPPMGAPCMGATGNRRHFFIGDQPNQWYNLQAQVGGARRWVVPAEELQLVLPDPLVLAGVVAKMSDALAAKLARLGGAQAAYRLSSVRQHLGIDLRPGMQEIRTFSELLQAEAGEMVLRQPGNTIQGPTTKPNNVVGVKSMSVVGVKSMSGPDQSGNPRAVQKENKMMQLALQPEEGGRNRSCQLMRLMWSTRRRVSTG